MSELLKRTSNYTILSVSATGEEGDLEALPVISEIRLSGISRAAVDVSMLDEQYDDFRPGTINLGTMDFDMPFHLSEDANALIETLKEQETPVPLWRRTFVGNSSGEDNSDDLWGFVVGDSQDIVRNERRIRRITVQLVPQPAE